MARTTTTIGRLTLGDKTVEYFGNVYGTNENGWYAEMRLRLPPPCDSNNTTTEVCVAMADETFQTREDASEWCMHQMKSTPDLRVESAGR